MKRRFLNLLTRVVQASGIYKLAPCLGLVKPRIIAMVDGGLGSQMRQFALGYCVSRKTGLPLLLETSFFTLSGCDIQGNKNRQFLLMDTFPLIKEKYGDCLIEPQQEKIICRFFSDADIKRKYEDFNPELFQRRPRYIKQYYNTAAYFRGYEQELRELFRFGMELTDDMKELEARMQSAPHSCSVHIRKGDYVGCRFDVCTDAYYLNAMKRVHSLYPEVEFFIFSNDEEYARKLCQQAPGRVTLVQSRSEEDPRIDLYLLTQSKHSIIANSNFSWMGAFLRQPDGVTIMPDIWWRHDVNSAAGVSSDMFKMEGWIQMKV